MTWKNRLPGEALKLVGGWIGGIVLVCGLWLAVILFFLESADRANLVRLSAYRIRVHELEARRFEKDFLLRGLDRGAFFEEVRSEYLERHAKELEGLRREAATMERAGRSLGWERSRLLLEHVERYEDGFQRLVAAYRERGSGSAGLTGRLEERLEAMRKAAEPTGKVDLERLVARIQEGARELTRDPASYASVDASLAALEGRATETPEVLDHAKASRESLASLRKIEERIGLTEELGLQGEFRRAVHEVEPLVARTLLDATRMAERAHTTLLACILTACLIIAVLLGLAIFFAATARLRNRRLLQANIQMEEEHRKLLQSERLAAIGEMVTGLAHESRNALQRTHACLDILAQEVLDRPRAMELVERIEESQDYLHLLYEQVREYAAPPRLKRKPTALPEIVQEAWRHLEAERTERNASLDERADGVDCSCDVDAFSLEQVFRNIFENALAACDDPVRITVQYAESRLADRPAVQVSFVDNGPGLDAEQRARIFEPFYTTKVKGTGLGMAIARRIVDAHGGSIVVGERLIGAEIIVTLPRET